MNGHLQIVAIAKSNPIVEGLITGEKNLRNVNPLLLIISFSYFSLSKLLSALQFNFGHLFHTIEGDHSCPWN